MEEVQSWSWEWQMLVFAVIAVGIGGILFWVLTYFSNKLLEVSGAYRFKLNLRILSATIPVLFIVLFVKPYFAPIPNNVMGNISKMISIAFIAAMGWLAIILLRLSERALLARYRNDVADNLFARQIKTRFRILRRIGELIIIVLTIALILMQFSSIRSLGIGLLGSAGVAGIVLGVAARPILENIIAGIQIAFTQPFRVDDVVIVEGEWGRIEEITISYVVVKIWDLRRMVVPLSYFTDKPFQNWTMVSSDLLAPLYLYVDYSVPVEELRSKLQEILSNTSLWDGKFWNLQVSNATEKTIELRALFSVKNSSISWELRCLVREKMIAFLQQNYPQSLPKIRAEVQQ
ncbi:MAG: mechanosensitive ion channel family protein [Chlamydiota bacterium]